MKEKLSFSLHFARFSLSLHPIMSVTELIHNNTAERRFSFEVLPPLKGTGTDRLFADIDKLREFDPAYINITTHHSEFVYRELPSGQFERQRIRRVRPSLNRGLSRRE